MTPDFIPQRVMPTLMSTDELVEAFHRGQSYGDEPYVNHVRRVAERLRPHGEWAYMAGLLHDVVEDTEMTLDGLWRLNYPAVVVEAVDAVTCRDAEDYFDRVHIAAAHPLGCHVKLADNTDNRSQLHKLVETDPRRARRLCEKYDRALEILTPARDSHLRTQGFGLDERMVFGPAMEPK